MTRFSTLSSFFFVFLFAYLSSDAFQVAAAAPAEFETFNLSLVHFFPAELNRWETFNEIAAHQNASVRWWNPETAVVYGVSSIASRLLHVSGVEKIISFSPWHKLSPGIWSLIASSTRCDQLSNPFHSTHRFVISAKLAEKLPRRGLDDLNELAQAIETYMNTRWRSIIDSIQVKPTDQIVITGYFPQSRMQQFSAHVQWYLARLSCIISIEEAPKFETMDSYAYNIVYDDAESGYYSRLERRQQNRDRGHPEIWGKLAVEAV
jgi:hypothetical protein